MKKTAFVFPGQGAQKFGMGKAFYETIGVSRKIYDQASQWLGMDVPALCFEENDRLDQTHYTQIGLLVTEIALSAGFESCSYFDRLFLRKYGVTPRAQRRDRPDRSI